MTSRGVRLAGAPFFFLLPAVLVLAACAAGPDPAALRAAAEYDPFIIDSVPFHGQRDFQCGPAALAMTLNASGVPVDVDELIPQVYLPAREGSLQPEMLATARRHGRVAFTLDGSMESLLAEVRAGHPVVVLQNLSLPAWPMWHYAVVVGHNLRAGRVILHTGETPAAAVGLRRFDNTWARSGRWALAVLPPGTLPRNIDATQAVSAIAAFEQVGGAEAALPSWRSAVERWPGDAMAWFALGNALWAVEDASEAVQAFREATLRDEAFGAAWINLGFALEAEGDFEGALRAFQAGAERPGPWQARARSEVARLTRTTE